MKKTMMAVLCSVAFSTSVMAEDLDKERKNNELIGLGSGVVVGSVIAGPLGGMVAGIIGVLVAEDVSNEKALANTTAELQRREQQLVALNDKYEKDLAQARLQLVSMDTEIRTVMEEAESSIQFKTASYVVEDHFKPQLDLLSESLKNNQRMIVQLSGFADRRGDEAYNQALSQQRVLSVKQYLVANGVDEGQIRTLSFGESKPANQQQSFETDFFDRRVVMRIEEGQQTMTAAN